jgi:hypothetical protein
MTMKHLRSGALLVLAVTATAVASTALAAPTGAWAQTAGAAAAPAPPPAAAPVAVPAPPPKPSPVLEQLKFFTGDWQCAGTGYLEGKGHPTSAKVHGAWELNNFFLGVRYEEQQTEVNPMPVTAVEHWGYGDELKKLVAGSVDSMGGYGTQATVGWEGDRMVWVGDYHLMGTKMPSRDTFVRKGANELTHLGEVQEKGAWAKLDEETCYRLAVK